ncbi:signal transduction histidine kinase [Streptosporangium album]|uniref:histidine kinase n=1 Tax=Streptosporangium album TaxID=47479 RepID=A0A7W7W8J4_9ACTN|nr:HAMP domain-containing sensor histidine kinase [Streptosporangium album]MBB4937050.1 signal transduction histidine kinase [Streptosporangium album]
MRFADRWSVRTRLTLFTSAAVGALCLAFSIALLLTMRQMATQDLTEEVTATGELTAYYVDRGEIDNTLPPIPNNLIRPIQVVDPQGRVVAATSDFQNKPAMTHFAPRPPHRVASTVVCDSVFGPGRCDIVVAQQAYHNGDWTVYTAAPTLPFYVYPALAAFLIAGTVVFTIAVAYGARRIITTSLKPVDEIRAQLDEIHSTDLGRRVPVPTPNDEICKLAQSTNFTLDRLEGALEQQRRFSSDASHELRTPITAIRAQVEDALMAPEDTDIPTLCHAVLPSLDRLQSLASDLLALTHLDAGSSGEPQRLDLSELVAAELDNRRPTKKIIRNLAPEVIVKGDRSRLSQLITELVDNAERHASSTITLTVRRQDSHSAHSARFPAGAAVLEVLDDGGGIPQDQRAAIFQRFARLDTARSRHAGGIGLGLPLAQQIAKNHGGTLTIQDSDRGAQFVVRLPLST